MDWTTISGILGSLNPGGVLLSSALTALSVIVLLRIWHVRALPPSRLPAIISFALGAVVFAPSIAFIQVPAQTAADQWASTQFPTASSFILAIPVILLTGLIQEPMKFLAALPGLAVPMLSPTLNGSSENDASPQSPSRWTTIPVSVALVGAMAGAGFGWIEAAIVLSYAISISWGAPFPWVALLERASAIVVHTSLAALVMASWFASPGPGPDRPPARGPIALPDSSVGSGIGALAVAAIAHSAVNYITVPLALGIITPLVAEALVAISAVAAAAWTAHKLRVSK